MLPPANVIVLGTDTMLAALPASSVQVVHACRAAGYDVAIPASWGDELVADACLRELAGRGGTPAIQCSCPCVARRLTAGHGELERFLVPLDPPPIAAARYVRALYAESTVHVTYAGGCPGGANAAIDRHVAPRAFLAELAEQGISLGDQPAIFESILPPDRRRHRSLPGGVPTPEALLDECGRGLIEISAEAFTAELAEQLLEHRDVLIDVAPRLGCVCSGSVDAIGAGSARTVVAALEPPRSATPVVDPRYRSAQRPTPRDVATVLEAPADPRLAGTAPPVARQASPREASGPLPSGSPPWIFPLDDGPRRRAPLHTPRSTAAFPLVRRAGGAALPRTYALSRAVSGRYRAVPAVDFAPRAGGEAEAWSGPVAAGVAASPETPGDDLPAPDGRVATDDLAPERHERSVPDLAATNESASVDEFPPADASRRGDATHDAPAGSGGPAAEPDEPAARHPLLIEAEFDAFLADIRETVAETVAEWRQALRIAIETWKAAGYATGVLERALALPREPNVPGLLSTFRAAVDHLAQLEAQALDLAPDLADSLRAHPVFRDPARVTDAEAVVQRLTRAPSKRTPTPAPASVPHEAEAPPTLVWDWITFEDRVIEELGPQAITARGWTSRAR